MILSRCHSVWDVLNGYRSEYKSTPRLTDHVLVVQLELYWCLPFWRDVAGSKLRREKVVWRRRIHLLRRGCIWYALGCIWSTDTLRVWFEGGTGYVSMSCSRALMTSRSPSAPRLGPSLSDIFSTTLAGTLEAVLRREEERTSPRGGLTSSGMSGSENGDGER